jgi:cytochrome c biogenesis protein
MAAATVIPQRAPDVVYERAFGMLVGPLIAQTTLRNVYGAWWFIGAFALLAINIAACGVQQIGRLSAPGRQASAEITQDRIAASQCQDRRHSPRSLDETEAAVREALRRRGYAVSARPTQSEDQRGLVGQRGRLVRWAPTMVHIGMVLVLVGAAYGRLPSNSYRAVANLDPGESFPVDVGGSKFAVRLLEAGAERDSEGRPTRFWARAEILAEEKVVKSALLEPNHPLRHRGVSVVLQSLPQTGYAVEVAKEEPLGFVPVLFTPEGAVDMMGTIRRLEEPPWIVFIHDFRDEHAHEHGSEGPSARVFVDRSGELSHNWEAVGWVDKDGLDYRDLHFRLVSGPQGAQLSLDRDIGVPIVWLVLVRAKGSGSQLTIGGSGPRVERDMHSVLTHVETELGG